MSELWRDVTGYEGSYQVSDHGKVRSVNRRMVNRSGFSSLVGKELKPFPTSKYGHLSVKLYKGGATTLLVHRLVLEAFVGPCPKDMECCHGDGNPANNCVDNLRWGSRKSNMDDREEHGNTPRGSTSGRAILSEEDIPIIRFLLMTNPGRVMLAIGERYSTDAATIRDIRDDRTWQHVPVVNWGEPFEKEFPCGECNSCTTHTVRLADNPTYHHRQCNVCNWFRFKGTKEYQEPLREPKHGSHCPLEKVARGESKSQSKLTEDDVRLVRKMKEEGNTYAEIIEKLDGKITAGSLCDIIKGRSWKHVK